MGAMEMNYLYNNINYKKMQVKRQFGELSLYMREVVKVQKFA